MNLEEELIDDIYWALVQRFKEIDISFKEMSRDKKSLLISVDGLGYEIYVARIPNEDTPQKTDDSEREDLR